MRAFSFILRVAQFQKQKAAAAAGADHMALCMRFDADGRCWLRSREGGSGLMSPRTADRYPSFRGHSLPAVCNRQLFQMPLARAQTFFTRYLIYFVIIQISSEI